MTEKSAVKKGYMHKKKISRERPNLIYGTEKSAVEIKWTEGIIL